MPPPLPLSPAWWVAAAVAAVVILISVTVPIFDTDLWQHLTVGKAIWTLHQIPTRQLWSWPTYGGPDVTSSYSWLFRAILWPLWSAGGVTALFAWRWATTLAAFALMLLAARRMGAGGFATLGVFVLAALTWRQRAMVRPETLAAVLLALEVWILESRRQGGPDRGPWLIGVLWLWVNAHLSYTLGFAVVAIHLAGGAWDRVRGRTPPRSTRTLARVALIAAAAAFLNPYGWRALWQPFDFALHLRHEPIFRGIGELLPPAWGDNLRNGLPLLIVGWPLLLLLRARRRGLDLAELLTCVLFTALALSTQRFLGFTALVAAPYLARDLEDALSALPRPVLRAPWARSLVTCGAMVALAVPEWRRPELPIGSGVDWRAFPVAACDAIEARHVRGRGFTPYAFGGYLLWRFWPQRDRLPFMDIHQSGTPEIRALYARAFSDPGAWAELDRRWRFDYALLARVPLPGETLLDRLDADPDWSLVFLDDAAALYVRRAGPLGGLAREGAYRVLGAGPARMGSDLRSAARDSAVADSLTAELERQARESRWNASAWNLLGWVATERRQPDRARPAFQRAVALNEMLVPGAHAMLARIALGQGRPDDALLQIGAERRVAGAAPSLDALEGRAWRERGDAGRARAAWRRALARDPGLQDVRDSLDALETAGAR